MDRLSGGSRQKASTEGANVTKMPQGTWEVWSSQGEKAESPGARSAERKKMGKTEKHPVIRIKKKGGSDPSDQGNGN